MDKRSWLAFAAGCAATGIVCVGLGLQPAGRSEAASPAKWEYGYLNAHGFGLRNEESYLPSQEQLNRYGQMGWEAVGLAGPKTGILMKRPR